MPSWLGPAALLSPENALSPVEDCIQVFIGVLAPSRDGLCILLSKNDLAVHGYPHSSILAGDRMQGTVQNLLRERPVMSLEGQFSHGVCCHLAGAVLGGSSRVTFLSAIFLPPSSEAAKAWWRFSEGFQWLQQDSQASAQDGSRPKNLLLYLFLAFCATRCFCPVTS